MNGRMFALVLLGFFTFGAGAEPLPADEAAEPPAPETTRGAAAWLELQREGSAAGEPNTLPGDAAARAYERYLKSFEAPIPQNFGRAGGE